jgi:AraC-like DNA-binding protein
MQVDKPSTVNITHIAMANGFMQMGYFASEYKKMFGETPSETLRRVI